MSLTLTRRYNVDRFGYLIPHRYGNLPMVGAVATYRPGEGRFGGAVAVEGGTTNLFSSQQAHGDGGQHSYNETPIIPGFTGESWEGSTSFKVDTTTVAGDGHFYHGIHLLAPSGSYPAGQYTFSCYVKAPSGTALRYGKRKSNNDGTGTESFDGVLIANGQWQRITYTYTTTATESRVGGQVIVDGSVAVVFYVDGAQVEQKPFATSFVDGRRAAGRLSYPKSLIAGLNALTVAAWTSGPPYWAGGIKYLVAAQTSGTSPYGDYFALRQRDDNRISLWVRNDVNSSGVEVAYDNVWDGNWHHIVGVINKFPQPGREPIELYVDGELVASNSNVNAVPDLSNIDEALGVQVGNWRSSLWWNGLIDELLILPYAASEEEIASWYEAQGLLPPHPQALLQWDWQAVRPAQMVKL